MDYAIENLPLNDTLLKNAEFVNFSKREQATISQVVYFVTRSVSLNHCLLLCVCRYSTSLQYTSPQDMNKLEEQFLQYQTMNDSDTPMEIWEEALRKEDKDEDVCKYRMDIIWAFLITMKNVDGKLTLLRWHC